MIDRRGFLTAGAAALASATLIPQSAFATANRRTLHLYETHSFETASVTYWTDGWYNPDALHRLDIFLRDWRTDEVAPMDPRLLDAMALIQERLGTDEPMHIVCGYRSPTTNAVLASQRGGVARNSYHVRGQAADIHLPHRTLGALRQTAQALEVGGVGFYPRSGFVHIDTGPVRSW
ncbi:MAG: DUF882 domain-containing protein [Pseudomonadota bacterium]